MRMRTKRNRHKAKRENEMKKYFEVMFERSEGVFCVNIAHAETLEDVREYYSEYKWFYAKRVDECAVKASIDRGTPVIEI